MTSAARTVVVRRRVWPLILVAAAAFVVATGYAMRFVVGGSVLAGVIAAVLGLLGVVLLAAAWAWRGPLLVADATGVRLLWSGRWHGLPWRSIDAVDVGRDLTIRPAQDASSTGPFTFALGPLTSVGSRDLVADLADLSAHRVDLVEGSDPRTWWRLLARMRTHAATLITASWPAAFRSTTDHGTLDDLFSPASEIEAQPEAA